MISARLHPDDKYPYQVWIDSMLELSLVALYGKNTDAYWEEKIRRCRAKSAQAIQKARMM